MPSETSSPSRSVFLTPVTFRLTTPGTLPHPFNLLKLAIWDPISSRGGARHSQCALRKPMPAKLREKDTWAKHSDLIRI